MTVTETLVISSATSFFCSSVISTMGAEGVSPSPGCMILRSSAISLYNNHDPVFAVILPIWKRRLLITTSFKASLIFGIHPFQLQVNEISSHQNPSQFAGVMIICLIWNLGWSNAARKMLRTVNGVLK